MQKRNPVSELNSFYLKELPEDNRYRLAALELLYNLKTILDARQDLDR
jgi:hypothetical protein